MTVKELIKALAALPGDAPVTLLVKEGNADPLASVPGDLASVSTVRDLDGEIVSVTLSEDEPS